MKKVEYIISKRRLLAKLYDNLLDGYKGVERIIIPDHVKSVYYKYIVFLPSNVDRQSIKQQLFKDYNISLISGTGSNPTQNRVITDYDGTTKAAIVLDSNITSCGAIAIAAVYA